MAGKPKKLENLGSGGYTDKPWFLRFWDGMIATGWFPLLVRNRFQVSPRRWAMAALMSILSLMNLGLALLQTLFWGRRIARAQLQGDPIFVIGHWRSGTTLLHELLVLDERHTYPNTFDCFCPSHFLLSSLVFRPMLAGLLPKQRPMDNMAAGWDCPQEDEFALCNLGMRSPYLTIAFSNRPPQNQEFFELAAVSPRQRRGWKQGLLWFLKCLTLRSPRRIVLKSPPHTFRIKVLLEMFPQARFIHIIRDPFVIFPSTINLWKRLYRNDGLQVPTYDGLEEHVFETFSRMYEVFERDHKLIPDGQFCEVRYEDLVARPIQQMQRIYEDLHLEGFEVVRPRMESYFAQKADYKTNRYQLPPELAEEIRSRWASYFTRYGYSTDPRS
jgi:omega-hydroxy-beta-dihydromenaquinone-9 sulfotransferase